MPGKRQHFQEPEIGCCGKCFLFGFNIVFWFSVFLGLIFFLELATGIQAFVFKGWIRDQLDLFINNNVKAYRDDIDLQNLIDFAQEYWSCCGAPGPNDWNLNIYFNCTDLNPSWERCGCPSPAASVTVACGRCPQHPVWLQRPAQTGAGAAGLHPHQRLRGPV
ncbi:tetraspanin-17-like [Sapajus apella]|uniref:Tetraspanin-17-like n=1 Tax=Sapajus apella TaxID=9515 RepID=A0A6J3FLK1_SAPAP|nr:tetraspanin-17-like [Sapajus apella]